MPPQITLIKNISDLDELFALKELCSSAQKIKDSRIFLGDDGEWEHQWERIFTKLGKEIKKVANIAATDWRYEGELSVEALLKAFVGLRDLMFDYIAEVDELQLRFNTAYEYLDRRYDPQGLWASVNKTKKQIALWESIHPSIERVTHSRYSSGHYADAVEAGFKEVIKRVKDYVRAKTDTRLDGEKAINRAFGFENQEPIIKFNALASDEEKDEQRGLLNLFKGIVGIRNRKAHENVVLEDPDRAFEYLALASLLMRLLDQNISD